MTSATALHIFFAAALVYFVLAVLVRLGLGNYLSRILRGHRTQPLRAAGSRLKTYAVRYAAESSRSLFRLIPWDASGTLTASDAGFHFEGNSPTGRKLQFDIDAQEATINYQKGTLWWDGGVSWCVIEVNGEKHYFTSEALEEGQDSRSAMEDGLKTTDIYQQLTNRYIKLN